jgi:hypothetical protein
MRILTALLTVGSLLLTVATFPIIGGVVFALFLFFPLFLLGLLGVLAGLEDRTVEQHNPAMDATAWRTGPQPVRGERRVSSARPASVGRQRAGSRSTPRRAVEGGSNGR